MPDDTRPTRSKFFQVLKSVLSFDGSINRITSNPGGKNVSIIFAYATSLAYEKSMQTRGPNGKTGEDVFKESEWLTPKEWLTAMGWGGKNGEITSHAKFVTEQLLLSFHQDEALEINGEYPDLSFTFKKSLDYPSDEQVAQARKSNKYFMLCLDDLINFLPKTLETGKPVSSRGRSTYLPLWEALLSDPLSDVFREEMIYQAKEKMVDLKGKDNITILELGTGTGSATIRLIRELIEEFENTKFKIYCYEEVANQINRAKERISSFDKKMKTMYSPKNIEFEFEFHVKKYKDPINLETDSLDLILTFQNLHYTKPGDRFSFLENLARMIHNEGIIIMAQTTNYTKMFPHPLSLAYLAVEGFQGYPTVEEMKELTSAFFKKTVSSGIDTMWVMSKPKFN